MLLLGLASSTSPTPLTTAFEDAKRSEVSVGRHQVDHQHHEGALGHCPCQLHVVCLLPIASSDKKTIHRAALYCTGHADRRTRVANGLRLLARRIRSFPEGKFTPSPPPSIFSVLTDELLVDASDAVTAVAAEEKELSGNAGFRLLAWTVADARGAMAPLDAQVAMKVGKRLDSRAITVRGALAQATGIADTARAALAEAEYPGAADMTPADVAAARAEIDGAEQRTYTFHRTEIYVGFHELKHILPRPTAGGPVVPRYPELVPAHDPRAARPLPAMPPDLAAALSAAAGKEILASFGGRDAWKYNDDPEAHVWWTQILPDFVDELRAERDEARESAARQDRQHRADWESLIISRDEVRRQRDAAVEVRDAALEARDDAVEARDDAVDEATRANMNVVSVQQSQQHRISLYSARIEELEDERERMITHIIS